MESKWKKGKVNSNEYAWRVEIQNNIKRSEGQKKNQYLAGVRTVKIAFLMNIMNKNNSTYGISVFRDGKGNLFKYKRQENPRTVAGLHLGESHTIGRWSTCHSSINSGHTLERCY